MPIVLVVGSGLVAHDAEHVGLASVVVQDTAHHLPADLERAVRPAIGRGPCTQRDIWPIRLDPYGRVMRILVPVLSTQADVAEAAMNRSTRQ